MPKAKKKPAPQSESSSTAATNGFAGEVFNLAEAAAYLRITEKELLDLIYSQNLPGRFIGNDWRFLKSAIQQWLSAGAPTPDARKHAQLALAGKYKDDPDLMRICEEAYRQREKPLIEGE